MTNSGSLKLSEEDVLFAFAVESAHDSQALERFLSKYPEYIDAILDLSMELELNSSHIEGEEEADSTRHVEKAWHRFMSVDNNVENALPTNPFANFGASEIGALSKQLGISKLMFTRLRDRTIDATTIPSRFIERVAICLSTTVDLMNAYLEGEPNIASGASFKSDLKPEASEKISFNKAVEISHHTPEQRADLMSLI
jgi:hypothetical protein